MQLLQRDAVGFRIPDPETDSDPAEIYSLGRDRGPVDRGIKNGLHPPKMSLSTTASNPGGHSFVGDYSMPKYCESAYVTATMDIDHQPWTSLTCRFLADNLLAGS